MLFFFGDHGVSQSYHVTTIALFLCFLAFTTIICPPETNLSSHCITFIQKLVRYNINFQLNFFQICHSQISNFTFLFLDLPPQRDQIHKYKAFPMDLHYCHIQDPSCNSFFTQPNKIVSSHALYILIAHL